MASHGLSPAQLSLPHLTLAKSGLTFDKLNAIVQTAQSVNEGEEFYQGLARYWLNTVDHPIPEPETLSTFPAPGAVNQITLEELYDLKTFLQQYKRYKPVSQGDLPTLAEKLRRSQEWVSVSAGSSSD